MYDASWCGHELEAILFPLLHLPQCWRQDPKRPAGLSAEHVIVAVYKNNKRNICRSEMSLSLGINPMRDIMIHRL